MNCPNLRNRALLSLGLLLTLAAASVPGHASAQRPMPARKARLRVALIIDASGSMKRQDPNYLSRVAAKLFVDLAGPSDEVGIVEFGTSARLIGKTFVVGEHARKKLYGFIDQVGRAQECTDYRVGLSQALEMFKGKPAPGERRLIIFLTDGTYDPDRSNAAYYTLLSDEDKQKVWSTRVQKFYEKARGEEDFKKRPCAGRYKMLKPAARLGFKKAFDEFVAKKLRPAGVKVFAIGFGTALGGGQGARVPPDVIESLGLLKKLAKQTRGKALIESNVNKIPGFFAEIFASLVGAPVESKPEPGKKAADRYQFKVIRGARAVGVVVPTRGDKTFAVELQRAAAGKFEPVKAERVRQYNEVHKTGRVLAGYRFFWVANPKPGTYQIVRKAGSAKTFRAQILLDVGLKLVWLKPTLMKTYAEQPKGELAATFGLRTASGEQVSGLSEKFMSDMRFYWMLRLKGKLAPVAQGQPDFDPAKPMKPMTIKVPRVNLKQGEYELDVWGAHEKGFFELRRLSHRLKVIRYIVMDVAWTTGSFDIKAKEGFKKKLWITLSLKKDLEDPHRFRLDLSGIPNRKHLTLRLTNTTSSCAVKSKKLKKDVVEICLHKKANPVKISLALRNWKKARKKDLSFAGPVKLTPVRLALFKGKKAWETKTSGQIREWTLGDWIKFYKWYVIAAILIFLILLWLIGRALAGAFPPKAMLYYRDVEEKDLEPSSYRLGQKTKSFLPFVSASHDIGGSGVPRGGKTLCVIKATAGGMFRVEPDAGAVTWKDGEDTITKKDVFDGRYDEHYTVGDRYEFWLTRTPE